MTITLIGGTVIQPKLTKKLYSENPREFHIGKAIFWNAMLGNGEKPVCWYAPNEKGRKVLLLVLGGVFL